MVPRRDREFGLSLGGSEEGRGLTVQRHDHARDPGGRVLRDPTQDVLVRPFPGGRRRDEDLRRMRVHGRVRLRGVEGLAAELLGHGDRRELVVGLAAGVQGVEGNRSGDGALLLRIVDPEPSPVRVPGRHVQGPCGGAVRPIEELGPEPTVAAVRIDARKGPHSRRVDRGRRHAVVIVPAPRLASMQDGAVRDRDDLRVRELGQRLHGRRRLAIFAAIRHGRGLREEQEGGNDGE